MADTKISDLPSATTVADADLATVVQSGTNKKSALSVIKTYIQTAFNTVYVPLTRTLNIGGTTQDLSANRTWTTTTILDGIGSPAQGDILYRGASNWARLGAGTSGNILTTAGASANPSWAANAAVPTSRTLTIGGSALDLSANRSWTTSTILDGLTGAAQGDILYRGASNWVYLTPGTNGNVLTTHGASANPTWDPAGAPAGAALTKVDDTNVTLTLGGTPSTALLQASSLTLGWTGTLAPGRGGTGVNNTGTITLANNLVTSGNFSLTLTQTATTNVTLPTTGTLGTLAGTETLTNKRVTKRVTSTSAPGATPTINTDNCDAVHLTALGTAITSMTTNLSGTPVQGDMLRIDFTDDGTARAITWGASFEASTVALPTTTVVSTRLDVGFIWNTVTTKWRCVAVA